MRFALYLGCQIPLMRPDLEVAIRETLDILGVKLEEMKGYSCCPFWISVPSYDLDAWLAISARNISIAEEKGLDIVLGCNNCYSVLNHARDLLKDEEIKERVNRILFKIGRMYRGTSKIYHYLHIIEMVGKKRVKDVLKYKLNGLVAAVQPGCHMLWPTRIMDMKEDNPFFPRKLRDFVEMLGAKAPHYSRIEMCCGMGSMRTIDYEKSLEFVLMKVRSMKEEIDPDFIVSACSSCYIQLDEGQKMLKRYGKLDYEIPVFYYPQLLAICMGIDPKKVARISSVPKDDVIKRILEG